MENMYCHGLVIKNSILNSININERVWGVKAENTNPTYDSTGKMISATW